VVAPLNQIQTDQVYEREYHLLQFFNTAGDISNAFDGHLVIFSECLAVDQNFIMRCLRFKFVDKRLS